MVPQKLLASQRVRAGGSDPWTTMEKPLDDSFNMLQSGSSADI